MSERSFRRMLVNSLGIPPGEWLRAERAVAAGYLLQEGRPVKEVSGMLGFSHPSEFGKEFRRCYGTSPTNFQRDFQARSTGWL